MQYLIRIMNHFSDYNITITDLSGGVYMDDLYWNVKQQ